jgi:cation transport regulator ChaC
MISNPSNTNFVSRLKKIIDSFKNEVLKCLGVKSNAMRYFAYGSNMDLSQMQFLKVHFSQRVHAFLRGYALRFNKIAAGRDAIAGEGKGNIIEDESAVVEGVLYDGISTAGMNILRDRERGYNEKTVTVELENSERLDAGTFIARDDRTRGGLKPTKKYLSHYLAAKDILSESYMQRLRSTETLD